MGSTTGIEWCDATHNPWIGCTKVSEGCTHCYFYRDAKRYGRDPSKIVRSADRTFRMPMSRKRIPPGSFVFVCSWSDFFHPDVPDEWRHEALGMMAFRHDVTFLLLTKRPERMAEYLGEVSWPEVGGALACEFDRRPGDARRAELEQAVSWLHGELCEDEEPQPPWSDMAHACCGLPNVWLGVTAENQARADERIPTLLGIEWPGNKFVSVEPMIEPVSLLEYLDLPELHRALAHHHRTGHDCGSGYCGECKATWGDNVSPRWALDYVIAGAESGPRPRPMDLEWARGLRDLCVASHTPFMLKQAHIDGQLVKAPELDGRRWLERPIHSASVPTNDRET